MMLSESHRDAPPKSTTNLNGSSIAATLSVSRNRARKCCPTASLDGIALLAKHDPREQASVLKTLLSNCAFDRGSLTPAYTKIREQVDGGRYASASEVVRDALRLLEEQEAIRLAALDRLRAEIREGLESGTPKLADAVLDRLERKYEAMAKGARSEVRQVLLTPRAEQDLEEIGDYIAIDNPGRARTFVQEIRACFPKMQGSGRDSRETRCGRAGLLPER